ncbi:conserved hypothetical protein; putative endonuclease [Nitrosococcus halophilus Nc 4]|uniref:HNH endonuclease n=1 Tax=Nitrosococcus halophilus (strain Nc4) TaxID=472759 RepID=D5BYY0_NITHN|nr:HNH endonuclease [Nitrosococcus halophilus]ADE14193.1 conserved hypothetical protein; putative endonuclease [Nitrosococcus halophilus Nc 4]
MRLNVDLSALHAAVRRMGAEPVAFSLEHQAEPLDPIDIKLEEGIELLNLKEVESNNGLLSYKGRQILLYIQDQGNSIKKVLEDGSQGRKFHVADCKTLKNMRAKGRFERYVVTHRLNGQFYIVGRDWHTRQNMEGYVRLQVCQNCLEALNYKGAQHRRKIEIAQSFDIQEFYSTYSSFFSHLPRRWAGRKEEEDYTADWPQVTARYKDSKKFTCESCGVNLRSCKELLHSHHRNGVKSDNRESNLMALCAACHRQQPHHGHLCVSHEGMQTINRLRREQGLLHNVGWNKIFELCDPGLRGVLDACCHWKTNVPEVGFDVQDTKDAVVANLELAWPQKRVGLAISDEDRDTARKAGWRIWRMHETLEDIGRFAAEIED